MAEVPVPELPTFESGAPSLNRAKSGHAGERNRQRVLTEGEVPQATEETEKAGAGGEKAARSQKVVDGKRPDVPGPGKAAKTPWTATATIEGGVSPDVAYGIAARERRIHEANTLQHLTDLRASGATEAQMMAWAEINDKDAETAQMVASEHFPRMRDKVRALQQDVDDARSLKVDPYHWHKSIGRGGRVAAAFAALTGGFAAGKNNPNSAVKMMQTAIEQDISAQEQDIRNTFEALKTQKGLLTDERILFEEQMNAMNKIRATKYAAIVGRIQAAKQHAVTEAHHLALQTAEDHFEVKMLQAIAAAQKEVLRLELDGPLRNAAQLAAYKEQIANFRGQVAAGPAGGITVPTEQVSTLTGDTVGQRPEATIQMGAAPSRAASVAARGSRPTRPSSKARPSQETAAPAIPEGAVAQDAEGRYLDASGAVVQAGTKPAKKKAKAPKRISQTAVTDPDIQAPRHIAKEGSFARAIAKEANESVVGITTWDQAQEDIDGNRKIRNGGLTGTRDAEIVSASIQPPDPKTYKGGEENLNYLHDLKRHEYMQAYPEVLERPSAMAGERATITAGGRTYVVLAGARDEKTYTRVREEIVKTTRLIDGLNSMAQLIKKKGISGIFTDEGGFNIPGLNTSDPATLKKFNKAITQAMNFIKTHDPTARISDKDLEVGERAAVPYLGKGDAFLDFIQSLDGNPMNNTKRKQIERFLGALAVEASNTLFYEIENEVVPNYNALIQQKKISDEITEFTRQAAAE